MDEPTSEQCTANAPITMPDGSTGYAVWYPQMGGYVGRAIIWGADCFEALVWHDGDFPFLGDDPYREDSSPRQLHHCDPHQFIAFGKLVLKLLPQEHELKA